MSKETQAMSKVIRNLCIALLAVLIVTPAAMAQRQGRGNRGQRDAFALPRQIELTDDQKAKVAEIKKKYEEKYKAAQEKSKLTEEQTTKQREAFRKAREEKKTGEDARKAVEEALGLSDDQKKGREEMASLRKEITTAIEGVLTDEQKAKLKELRENGNRRRQTRNAA
jgi:Spy/CpxP family protein refolding chaperone